ncbi:hypothetical protein [Rudanella lutea]|uniref:hypothetical protein n=1 Tax=Rudanella lutea TaxID=451374 RepID=UPI0003779D66|nr:hypothetical protein [Rudanella lutea]
MEKHPLWGWIPTALVPNSPELYCRWQWVGGHPFDAPFFDETLRRCLSEPQNSGRYQTLSTLDSLVEMAQSLAAVEPTAFIFHVSRCGSTLLSQLLCLDQTNIVLSEMPLLDELLFLPKRHPQLTPDQQETYIRAVLTLVGQPRTGHEKRLFVKLDSWHAYYYDLIRRFFPTTPIVLLYRSPEAVIASQRKHRGMHAVPALLPPYLFGLKPDEVQMLNFDAYMAQVLTYYYARFGTIADTDPRAFLLAYQPDGTALMRDLAQHLNLSIGAAGWQAIEVRSRYHAKRGGQVFSEEAVSDPDPPYLERPRALFEQLESRRVNRAGVPNGITAP